MSYNILNTAEFSKELKKISKKYPSLKNDYLSLLYSLKENPTLGKSLGNNVFKIRMSIKSKSAGKIGGARVITFVRVIANEILMISIYDKSDQENISEKEINERLKHFFE